MPGFDGLGSVVRLAPEVRMPGEPKLNLREWQAYTTVYGPVPSWRVGASLGVDLIVETSICSFNCIYCQLGNIVEVTAQRREFVPTEKVIRDLEQSNWRQSDVVTFSGSGEPTLATNLGAVNAAIQERTGLPTLLLTNGALLHIPEVRADVNGIDRVFVKLDAATPETFKRINRPAAGVSLESIVAGAKAFRADYSGYFGLQCMFMPANFGEAEAVAALAKDIAPDEIQLNTPRRPHPDGWYLASRGSHETQDYPARPLKTLTPEQAEALERQLRDLTGIPVVSVYGPDEG